MAMGPPTRHSLCLGRPLQLLFFLPSLLALVMVPSERQDEYSKDLDRLAIHTAPQKKFYLVGPGAGGFPLHPGCGWRGDAWGERYTDSDGQTDFVVQLRETVSTLPATDSSFSGEVPASAHLVPEEGVGYPDMPARTVARSVGYPDTPGNCISPTRKTLLDELDRPDFPVPDAETILKHTFARSSRGAGGQQETRRVLVAGSRGASWVAKILALRLWNGPILLLSPVAAALRSMLALVLEEQDEHCGSAKKGPAGLGKGLGTRPPGGPFCRTAGDRTMRTPVAARRLLRAGTKSKSEDGGPASPTPLEDGGGVGGRTKDPAGAEVVVEQKLLLKNNQTNTEQSVRRCSGAKLLADFDQVRFLVVRGGSQDALGDAISRDLRKKDLPDSLVRLVTLEHEGHGLQALKENGQSFSQLLEEASQMVGAGGSAKASIKLDEDVRSV